jgi:hypothetical protein
MPMKFSGHETFACRYAWLPKALQAIQSDPRVFADDDEAIVELGVGKNMVRSIRFWVEASGMAKPAQQGLEPTKLRVDQTTRDSAAMFVGRLCTSNFSISVASALTSDSPASPGCRVRRAAATTMHPSGEFISQITLPIRCVTNLCDV